MQNSHTAWSALTSSITNAFYSRFHFRLVAGFLLFILATSPLQVVWAETAIQQNSAQVNTVQSTQETQEVKKERRKDAIEKAQKNSRQKVEGKIQKLKTKIAQDRDAQKREFADRESKRKTFDAVKNKKSKQFEDAAKALDDSAEQKAFRDNEQARAKTIEQINGELKSAFDAEVVANPDVQTADVTSAPSEPDYIYAQDGDVYVPNDPDLQKQWYLNKVMSQTPDIFSTIGWQTPIVVAVIDSGVDYTHADLQKSMWSSSVCVDENNVTKPTGCSNGYDYVDNDNDPFPTDGSDHGTAVASIIGAATDNGVGISSLGQNRVKIMSLRVANGGLLDTSAIVKAIYFAAYNNAKVINMSFSGPTNSTALQSAINFAESRGIIMVASSGNAGTNIDQTPAYPASYTNTNLIAVGSLSGLGAVSSFSNYGSTSVDVLAPGEDMWTATLGNSYSLHRGTSFSAPFFASFVARGLSENKNLQQVLDSLPKVQALSAYASQGKVMAFDTAVPPSVPPQQSLSYYIDSTSQWVNPQSKGGEYVAPGSQPIPFVLDATAPGQPTLVSPGSVTEGQFAVNSTSVSLQWSYINGANNYGVYVRDLNTNTLIVDRDYAGRTNLYTVTGLVPGHRYRWNVRASYSIGSAFGPFSQPLNFYVPGGQTGVATPTSLLPNFPNPDGYITSSTSIPVSWTASTTPNVSYKLEYQTTDGGYPNVLQLGATSFTLTGLTVGKNYKWTVSACINNYATCSLKASYMYFKVPAVNYAPSVPTVTGSGSVYLGQKYTVQASSVDPNGDTISYDVMWSTGGTTTVGAASGLTGYQTPITQVAAYASTGTYCVQVRATDNQSTPSNWSSCHNVTVSNPPADLVPISSTLTTSIGPAGTSTSLNLTVKNNGSAVAPGGWVAKIYLTPKTLGQKSNSYLLTSYTFPDSLVYNQQITKTIPLTLPASGSSAYLTGSGDYYIHAVIDATNIVAEGTGESNNEPGSTSIDTAVFTVGSGTSSTTSLTITAPSVVTKDQTFTATFVVTGLTGATDFILTPTESISPTKVKLVNGSNTITLKFVMAGGYKITAKSGLVSGVSSLVESRDAGSLYAGGSTIVRAVATNGTILNNAKVMVRSASGGVTAFGWTETTNVDGYVTIPANAIPLSGGLMNIRVEYTDSTGNVNVGEDYFQPNSATVTSKAVKVALATDNAHYPIVLVPGIMGSTLKNGLNIHSYPELPAELQPDASLLQIHDPTYYYSSLIPGAGWSILKSKLVNAYGYQLGKTIIECPYDWRLPDLRSANYYLSACIQKALDANPGKGKVDIIAHSQGGLLVRAYMQENGGANSTKIRKIAFVGTPHYGATEAYFAWEGGDPNTTNKFITGKIRENAILKNYSEVNGGLQIRKVCSPDINNTPVTIPSLPGVQICASGATATMQDALNTKTVINPIATRNFIKNTATSIRQLMPIYSFIRPANDPNAPLTKIANQDNDNEFLHALNGEPCLDGVCDDDGLANHLDGAYSFVPFTTALSVGGIPASSVKIIFDATNDPTGVQGDTVTNIKASSSTNPYLYEDGMPKSPLSDNIKTGGDQTVPGISGDSFVNAASLSASKKEIRDLEHGGMVGNTSVINELAPLFTDGQSPAASSIADAAPNKVQISFTCPVSLYVTDPSGKTLGVNPSTNIPSYAIPSATLDSSSSGAYAEIENPVLGKYQLVLTGSQPSSCTFKYAFLKEGVLDSNEFKFFHSAGSQNKSFTLK